MYPIDTETKKFWSRESVQVLTDKLRAEVDAELRARDVSRGLKAENGYKTFVPDSNGRFVVDPALARAKHTGRERRLLLARRMAEFCMEPQSEAEFRLNYVQGDRRKQSLQRWIDRHDNEDVSARVELPPAPQDANDPEDADGVVSEVVQRRKPGRPRKSPLEAVA